MLKFSGRKDYVGYVGNLANQSYGKGKRTVLLQGGTSLKKDPFNLNIIAGR